MDNVSPNGKLAPEPRLPRLERRNTSLCRPPAPAEAPWHTRLPRPWDAESVLRAPSNARLAVMKPRLQLRDTR